MQDLSTGRLYDKGNTRSLFLGLLVATATVFFLCVYHVHTLKQEIQSITNQYLKEVSIHVSEMINYRLETVFHTLQTLTISYSLHEDFFNQDLQEEHGSLFQSICEQQNFIRIGIVGLDGKGFTSDGRTLSVADRDYVKRALTGESVASNVFTSDNGRKMLVYAVPIYSRENSKISGALLAYTSRDQLDHFLSVESFGGEGFSHIIDREGNFVVRSPRLELGDNVPNFFDMLNLHGTVDKGPSVEQMRQNLQSGKSGVLYYTLEDGISKEMTYLPLEEKDWYLLSVVPTAVSTQQSAPFIAHSIFVNLIITLTFLLLTVLVMFLHRRSKRKLQEIAFIDPVTKGYNRTWFDAKAMLIIRNAPPNTWALVSLDIQQFKLINDSFGSEAGNRTLKYIHDTIRSYLEPGEITARISADTFHILMKNSTPAKIEERLGQIVAGFNSFNNILDEKYLLPACEGVYIIDDTHLNIISIQDRANVARKNNSGMYGGKLSSCSFYTDHERRRMLYEKELINRMLPALENHEFHVYLQPKVELSRYQVAGAEALVRWIDPATKRMISPNEFIPLFERNGQIIKLDLYVFKQTCEILHSWQLAGRQLIPISVNLSRAHLSNPHFLDSYKAIFDCYNIPPQFIELELTETAFFDNLELLHKVINRAHEIGFTCSLDDFGSGYSSLNMLKDFPVDVLKLDRAFFIAQTGDEQRARHVIRCITELAKKLDMRTVAEGVESVSQVEFLRDEYCDMVQGYVFSRPLPVSEFECLAFESGKFQPQDPN